MKKMGIFFTDEPALVKALKEAEKQGKRVLAGQKTETITVVKDGEEITALVTVYDGEHDPKEDMFYAELEV